MNSWGFSVQLDFEDSMHVILKTPQDTEEFGKPQKIELDYVHSNRMRSTNLDRPINRRPWF
jgi:hypothetical protein